MRPGSQVSTADIRALAKRMPQGSWVLPVSAICAAGIPLAVGLTPAAYGAGAIIAIWIVLADGYTITYGFAGQFSVGHAALWGAGAYTTAILMAQHSWPFWPTIPLAVCSGCALGAVFGLPTCRLRGDYIALVTLAGGIVVQQIMLNWQLTGGADGIANISLASIGSHTLTDKDTYLLLFAMALLCTGFTSYLKHSFIGLSWRAIRDDEFAAAASGIRVTHAKILAFAVGGGLAGLSGALFAVFNGFVSSVSFGVDQSVLVILMVLLGGMGRVWGTAIAAALLTWLTTELTTLASVSVGITGSLLLLAIIVRTRHGAPWRRPTLRLGRDARSFPDTPRMAAVAAGKPVRRSRENPVRREPTSPEARKP
jgi:branched-chain amino acid transport system permease protein